MWLQETDLVPVARAKAPLSVQHKRPNGTQSIRNYCQQHTNVFHHDFNARALRKRQERLQNGYPIQQTSLLQVLSLQHDKTLCLFNVSM